GNKDVSRLICQEMGNANHIQELLCNCSIQEDELDSYNVCSLLRKSMALLARGGPQ
ncbi:5174_t:CDS:2, partial [Gigaspora margarita]